MADYNRIDLVSPSVMQEYTAGGVIRPGDLLEKSSGNVVASGTSGKGGSMWALHDRLQGKTIADNYASGDKVQSASFCNGSRVWAWLEDSQTVADGDPLTSAGTGGSLRLAVIGTDEVCAYADQALDLGARPGDTRIVVRVN